MKDSRMKRKLVVMYELFYERYRILVLRTRYRLRIMSPDRTISYIAKNHCCIARYGDGEFDLITASRDLNFQQRDSILSRKLEQVLSTKRENLLLCIPRCFNTIKGCNAHSAAFWIEWGRQDDHHQKIVNLIRKYAGKNHLFGDSQITRPYIDWKDSKRADRTFPKLRSLWDNKNVLIVEGEQTRLGVGNDLFSNANSIKRILAPAVGAFQCYDRIKQAVLKHYHGELILMALGPTATVLAADFADMQIQALDIGNIDIEYEWYIRRAKDRIAILGKFTNEVKDGRVFSDCSDPIYLSQIVEYVS